MGVQGFNVDHLGNVSRCIEKIGEVEGNVRKEPLGEIHERIKAAARASSCQDCWTVCRGYTQALGNGGRPDTLWDLSSRMRSA
jgi:radical SAM protein with 4Fe4S-binding SPASM domain